MGSKIENDLGGTLLSEEEKDGLLISGITSRQQLDEHEQLNIEEAVQWILTQSFNQEEIINEYFIINLHTRMYGNVWSWAGEFRMTNKNLGVDWSQIRIELKKLLADATYWIQNNTYSPEEHAIRFKHKLVSIHCFPNGNGRHSRLMADIIIRNIFKQPEFTWGAADLVKGGDVRKIYISSLQKADKGNITDLVRFARS
jgi:Fic-DOC domain mobile mystery protein B